MARIIDNNETLYHYVGGTKGNDTIFGNGLGHIIGGDGNDIINGAILDPRVIVGGLPILVYGGVGRFEVDGVRTVHPKAFTEKGGIGDLDHDGKDTIHYGIGYKVDGGSDADLYISHGPSQLMGDLTATIAAFNAREGDEFIFENSDLAKGETTTGIKTGFNLLNYKFDTVDSNTILLREVTIESYSKNPIIGEQVNKVIFDGEPGDWDGPRGDISGKIKIDWTGTSKTDDVEKWLAHHAGFEQVHIEAGSDHFDQFMF